MKLNQLFFCSVTKQLIKGELMAGFKVKKAFSVLFSIKCCLPARKVSKAPVQVNLWSAGRNKNIFYIKKDLVFCTCSRPALRPTWLRWLERKERGQSDESRAKSSQQKSGTSPPACMLVCSSTARLSISSFSASISPNSSSPPWNTCSHSCCRSVAEEQSTAACH